MITLVILAATADDGAGYLRRMLATGFAPQGAWEAYLLHPGDDREILQGRRLQASDRLVIRRTDGWRGDKRAADMLHLLAARLRAKGGDVVDPTGVLGADSLVRPDDFAETHRTMQSPPVGARFNRQRRNSVRPVQR